MNQLIAVSLIGIPASGKSTLAHKLLELSKLQRLDASVIIITFDDTMELNYSDLATGDYKRSREQLLHKLLHLMKQLKENDEGVWFDLLSSSGLRIDKTKFSLNISRPTLIILDDNMYFRSMRQRVRAICRDVDCAYFQIFMKCSLDQAIGRNQKRLEPVPEEIIATMFDRLEEPQNSRTITIVSELPDKDLIELINDRMKTPEALEDLAVKLTSPQRQSLLHDIDIATRREISLRIKAFATTENISLSCATLNRKRKEFLEELRAQTLEADDVESLKETFRRYLDEPEATLESLDK